jgi:hypothetical protein
MLMHTLDEAAKIARLVRRSLDREIARGTGPTIVHISPRRRGILDDDLKAWLMSRRRPAPGMEKASEEIAEPEAK